MKYILDTHTLLWISLDDKRLSNKVRKIYSDLNSELYLSITSLWEIAIKVSIGKIDLKCSFEEFAEMIKGNGITILNLTKEHLIKVVNLDFIHRDPFDRVIISQSLIEKMPVITSDKIFKKYKIQTIW